MNPYSEETLGALRNILHCYNKFEVGSWKETSKAIDVAEEQTLRRFAKGDTIPNMPAIARVYAYFRVRSIKRDLWEQPWAMQCRSDLERLYSLPAMRDPYRILKQRAKLSNEEQQRCATELKGDYFVVRPHPEHGSVLSHMRIFDSFPHYGLATCRISRAIREAPGGAIERDLIIEGGVFRKSSALNILGYDVSDGDVRIAALRDTGQGGYRGFITGFDSSSVAFSARAVVQRLEKPLEYEEMREKTGWWTEPASLTDFLVANLGSDHLFLERCEALETVDYATSKPGT
ncbi:hypothetical protein [Loktanella sp. SALINAS62]|uniref:hypothetical protein n=1 Tax=Loktanella sp. SALINAS62 TaxID=2706124 RepID=UPI001B8BB438|nr:hypothetical protein [Loktanella sp. SALINAS62]MBS1301977.1 hypothetical protein [Loktanella sp. SALINAS62]